MNSKKFLVLVLRLSLQPICNLRYSVFLTLLDFIDVFLAGWYSWTSSPFVILTFCLIFEFFDILPPSSSWSAISVSKSGCHTCSCDLRYSCTKQLIGVAMKTLFQTPAKRMRTTTSSFSLQFYSSTVFCRNGYLFPIARLYRRMEWIQHFSTRIFSWNFKY